MRIVLPYHIVNSKNKNKNMNFEQAKEALLSGKKVKLSDWSGYWFNDNGRIMVFTRDGDVLDTPNIKRYQDRDDWEETNGGMGFDFALRALFNGKKLQREGWNGKGQFVVMMPPLWLPPLWLPPYNTQGTERKVNDRTAKWIGEDKPLDCQPYMAIYNAQGKWQPGWLPSQGDMFADDWQLVD
jgi:hypothetical protein